MASTGSPISVRPVTPDDLEVLVPILEAMERHYEGADALSTNLIKDRVKAALDFLGQSPNTIWLAAVDSTKEFSVSGLGFATAFSIFPGKDLEPAWFLKELFVTDQARDKGVGEALMRALAQEIISRGGTRLDFTTDPTNEGAKRFYNRLGVALFDKVYFRAEGLSLTELAKLSPPKG